MLDLEEVVKVLKRALLGLVHKQLFLDQLALPVPASPRTCGYPLLLLLAEQY